MDLTPRALALSLVVSTIAGALVGLEREPRGDQPSARFAGIRTYPMFSLFGALCALAAAAWGGVVFAMGLAVLAGLLGLAYRADRVRIGGPERPGLTSEAAALVVFMLGALPFAEGTGIVHEGRLLLTIAGSAVLTGLLSMRSPLHRFARAVDTADVHATVQFVLLAAVALPLVPDVPLGPYGALNPHSITLVVVLVAAISFVGYAAVRALGPRRGIGLVGLFGGLVSSTAVTLTFSSRGRETPALARACAMAIVVASTVMFPRVLVELWALDRPLVALAAPPVLAMLGVGMVGVAVLWWGNTRRDDGEGPSPKFSNPFSPGEAFKVGGLFAVVLVVAAWAQHQLGAAGIYLSAAAAGLTDVDAIVLSLARMHADGELADQVAVRAITLATLVNTLVKAGMAMVLGGRPVGRPVMLVLGLVAATGLGVALVTT
mgnify:CR=1 FL=1